MRFVSFLLPGLVLFIFGCNCSNDNTAVNLSFDELVVNFFPDVFETPPASDIQLIVNQSPKKEIRKFKITPGKKAPPEYTAKIIKPNPNIDCRILKQIPDPDQKHAMIIIGDTAPASKCKNTAPKDITIREKHPVKP